jgi:RNA polymerase sigma-70 factor (ECF subfamily)
MISDIEDFRGLLNRIKEGDDTAAWELVEHYGEDIRNAVRRSLNRRLRPKFDSLDFVQLVWSSFFRKNPHTGQFASPEELVSYLVTMARNKVGMETRRRLISKKFNVNRESSLDEKSQYFQGEIPSLFPTPMEFAIARERWDRLLSKSPNHYKQIIQLRLQGRTCQDIADTMQIDESTVRRFLKRLQQETVE